MHAQHLVQALKVYYGHPRLQTPITGKTYSCTRAMSVFLHQTTMKHCLLILIENRPPFHLSFLLGGHGGFWDSAPASLSPPPCLSYAVSINDYAPTINIQYPSSSTPLVRVFSAPLHKLRQLFISGVFAQPIWPLHKELFRQIQGTAKEVIIYMLSMHMKLYHSGSGPEPSGLRSFSISTTFGCRAFLWRINKVY